MGFYCPICIEKLEKVPTRSSNEERGLTLASAITATVCGHIFHSICIQQWFKANYECPCCRVEVDLSKCIPLYPSKVDEGEEADEEEEEETEEEEEEEDNVSSRLKQMSVSLLEVKEAEVATLTRSLAKVSNERDLCMFVAQKLVKKLKESSPKLTTRKVIANANSTTELVQQVHNKKVDELEEKLGDERNKCLKLKVLNDQKQEEVNKLRKKVGEMEKDFRKSEGARLEERVRVESLQKLNDRKEVELERLRKKVEELETKTRESVWKGGKKRK